MAKGGTKVYCPRCKEFRTCRALPPPRLGKPKGRRWYRTDYRDIAWFRRVRECGICGHGFLSAETEEALLEELAELRERLAEKHTQIVRRLRRATSWLRREETIPKDLAKRFVAESAWWLTHSSGMAVRAPGHADRIYLSEHHGWAVEFGANTFLVGKAIERCRNALNDFFDEAAKGKLLKAAEVLRVLRQHISGAVANYNADEYDGYYPISDDLLVFGAQAIDVDDGATFILKEADASALFLGE